MQLPHVTGSKIAQMKLFANVTVRLKTKCFPNQNMSRPLGFATIPFPLEREDKIIAVNSFQLNVQITVDKKTTTVFSCA